MRMSGVHVMNFVQLTIIEFIPPDHWVMGGACKQQFKWHCLSTVNYSSFEVQLLKLEFFRVWSFIDLQST